MLSYVLPFDDSWDELEAMGLQKFLEKEYNTDLWNHNGGCHLFELLESIEINHNFFLIL